MESFKVSAIITCYNHETYLRDAINSVLIQTVPCYEIILVDDGSTDQTKSIADDFPSVVYIYQVNQGLSAARNRGISEASGNFLFFLDADDWLFPTAMEEQEMAFRRCPTAMAVAGDFLFTDECGELLNYGRRQVDTDNVYLSLLESNIVGMHATVLFKRELFDKESYDPRLKAAEDYDLLLRLARNYPIFMHNQIVAAYRKHANNMSKDNELMYGSVMEVLERQKKKLRTPDEELFYKKGIGFWKDYYSGEIYKMGLERFRQTGKFGLSLWEKNFLKQNNRDKYKAQRMMMAKQKIKNLLKKVVGGKLLDKIQSHQFNSSIFPGSIQWGSFGRTMPLSTEFGYDRGGPVDRYYIEQFLAVNAQLIKGTVLEIGDNSYTIRYGGERVSRSEVLHINNKHPGATIVGDLSNAEAIPIPDNYFDCIILTQTLHLIPDYAAAIKQCCRILRKGGALLLTTPGLSPIDKGEWKESWLWSFNKYSLEKILKENFDGERQIESHGNVLAATSFLWGIGLPEIPETDWMNHKDDSYPVVVVAKCTKH